MVKIELYQKFMNASSIEDLVQQFKDTLTVTNRTADFFVNWAKAKRNADEIKLELSLWNSLVGSKDIEADFVNLLQKYPEVVKTIPILFAIRERKFPIIVDFSDVKTSFLNLDFNKNRYSTLTTKDVTDYLEFARKGGLFQLFSNVKDFYDFVFGVEVGLDSNARKNRSGDAMETLLSPLLKDITKEINCGMVSQSSFNSVQLFGGTIPQELANRKSDFILYNGKHFVNIETNYFSGSGSKPEEIVDSYINRSNELRKNGWEFIWVTDGNVWNTSHNQILKAFKNIDYIFNVEFCRKGLLKEALIQAFT